MDASIRSCHDVASLTLLTASGELLSLVEVRGEHVDALSAALPRILTPDVLPDRLLTMGQLPRLGNGKIDQAGAASLAAGSPAGYGVSCRSTWRSPRQSRAQKASEYTKVPVIHSSYDDILATWNTPGG